MNITVLSSKSRTRRATPRRLAAACLPVIAGGVALVTASCGLLPPECDCDAGITKLVLETPVAGGTGLYGLFVSYHGHSLCEDGKLCVEDTFPQGITCDPGDPAYAASSPTNPDWTCTCTGSAVSCCLNDPLPTSLSNLPTIQVPVVVSPDAPETVNNCASIAQGFPGSFEDNNEKNNESCVRSEVRKPRMDLALEKSHEKPLAYDEKGAFQIVVSNVGDTAAMAFTVTDVLPPGFTFAGTSSPGWTCHAAPAAPATGQSQTVTCSYSGTLSPGASTLLDLQVQLGGSKDFTGKKRENCATVSVQGDVNPDNDTGCDAYCLGYSIRAISGVDDDFDPGNGQESPSPSPDLVTWISDNYNDLGVRDYDDASPNKYFGHRFDDLAPPPGYTLCGATVTLEVRCNDDNDWVVLHFMGAPALGVGTRWGQQLDLPPFDSSCDGKEVTLITLDLANLPPGATLTPPAASNLLPELETHGFLDVLVQDDTSVDHASIDVTYCCQ